jgi:hypothetical protein
LSFYDFDTKHKELYNASGIVTDELAKHLVEDEVPILEKWKQARQLDTKNLRILKIKEWVIKKCGKLCEYVPVANRVAVHNCRSLLC